MASTELKRMVNKTYQAVVFALIILVTCRAIQGLSTLTLINNCPSQITVVTDTILPQYNISAGESQVIQREDLSTGLWASASPPFNLSQVIVLSLVSTNYTATNYTSTNDNSTASTNDNTTANGDSYFLYVFGYNFGVEIRPTFFANGSAITAAANCSTAICSISNIQSVCIDGNTFAGPDNSCVVGTSTGADLIQDDCPAAFVNLSLRNVNALYECALFSSYEITYCP